MENRLEHFAQYLSEKMVDWQNNDCATEEVLALIANYENQEDVAITIVKNSEGMN